MRQNPPAAAAMTARGLAGGHQSLVADIPGARGQPHARFNECHFIQDELGPKMAEKVNSFIRINPRK